MLAALCVSSSRNKPLTEANPTYLLRPWIPRNRIASAEFWFYVLRPDSDGSLRSTKLESSPERWLRDY
jgi:hypothetical protein